LSGPVVDPSKTVTEAASTATFAGFILCVHGIMQLPPLWGGEGSSALAIAGALFSAGVLMWTVGRGLRRRRMWALSTMAGVVLLLLIASLCSAIWVFWPSPVPVDQEFAEALSDMRRFYVFFSVPWVLLLLYSLFRLRRPEVRALMGGTQ
jgi:hypothetical protein